MAGVGEKITPRLFEAITIDDDWSARVVSQEVPGRPSRCRLRFRSGSPIVSASRLGQVTTETLQSTLHP